MGGVRMTEQLPLLTAKDEAPILQSLQVLKQWAEDREEGGYHHTVIVGKVHEQNVDSIWLEQVGYVFSQGSGKSNLAHFHKAWSFPGVNIQHLIHKNGTWSLQITPRLVQTEPERMITYAQQILNSAFSGHLYFHVVVRRFEASRADSDQVLQWMKSQNIKEIKCYIHDSYEARVEVTYLDPAFSPRTSRLLAELG
jgi:hypothetical protein